MALRAVTSNGVAITPSSLTVSGTLTGSSGTATAASISPTINQSGTAGYTALDVNPTESATGSGTKLLQRWAVGGTELARITNTGTLRTTGFTSLSFGINATLTGAADVVLERDAADTLALRRSTNAQTFRLYETYTDASNYSRLNHELISNIWRIQTSAAGTGTARDIAINAGASLGAIYLQTSATTRWQIGGGGGGGNLLAGADNAYDIGASGATRPRNLYMASWIRMATTTVAALPAAATAAAGARMFVTDANATTFASVVAGGGANTVPVYSDGTNWRIG